jgi:glycosyltransferase involved in cell wall biosynthesis
MLRSLTGRDGQPGDYLWTATARQALVDLVRSWQPDVAIVRLGAGRALEVLKGAVPKLVYDAHNVEGPLYRRIMAANVPEGAAAPALLLRTAERTEVAEGALASAVDQIWVCSDQDAREMRAQYPGCAPVVVVPNTVAVPPELPARAATAKQHLRLVYPASFGYHPNVQAARWLSTQVLPRLRQAVPDAGLVLVGSGTPAALNLLAEGGEGIEVVGPVPDLGPYWDQATAVPVALRDGGGTRLKVLEAFAAGVPVIGTAKGLEGLAVVAGEHFLLAEDAPQFVAATLRIWHEPELRAYLSANAYQLACERYGPATAVAATERALAALS